jgi:anti-sigma factor RsiW
MECRGIVEIVTDYLEGALTPAVRRRFELHLAQCPFCTAYVEQMRALDGTLGALADEAVAPARRDELLAAFRGLRTR